MLTYDYIIAGAGCAGLSLVHHLLAGGLTDKQVLIIDTSAKTQNDKTWCFWSQSDFGYQSAKQRSWRQLSFLTEQVTHSETIAPLSYYHISSLDFYKEVLQLIEASDHIHFARERVKSIKSVVDRCTITTDQNQYEATWVFNSIPTGFDASAPENALTQHFFGQTVETDKPTFDPSRVYLMDFRMPNQQVVQFGYLLPFSENRALVEYTEFSDRKPTKPMYQALLSDYLNRLGVNGHKVLEEEAGVIPMSMHQFPQFTDQRIVNIGTAGGLTKPTTGYTFRNIQIDSQRIVKSLQKEGDAIDRRKSHSRFAFYDRLLLGIIREEPAQVKKIMHRLFTRNRFRAILRFLDEESTFWEEIKIFCSIPWAPFLRQLFKR